MTFSLALIPTRDGSRLVKRLLTHWGHKFEVAFDARQGHVAFDAHTRAQFEARDDALEVRLEAPSPITLARMQGVVTDHLQRMARGETLVIDWHHEQDGGPTEVEV